VLATARATTMYDDDDDDKLFYVLLITNNTAGPIKFRARKRFDVTRALFAPPLTFACVRRPNRPFMRALIRNDG